MGQFDTSPDFNDLIKDLKTRVQALENPVDTGWINLALGAGLTGVGTTPPGVRQIGNIGYLRGELDGAWVSGGTLATLPAALWPSVDVGPSINVWDGTKFIPQALNIFSSTGTMSVLTGQSLGSMFLGGVVYPLN